MQEDFSHRLAELMFLVSGMTFDPANDDDARKIGRKIAELRESRHLKNKDIADKMGVTIDAARKMVTGAATKSYAKLKKLAAALNSSPNEILGFSGGHDIDEIMAVVIQSYEKLGLSELEARLLAACVREAIEEPLAQQLKPDRLLARRVLASSYMRKSSFPEQPLSRNIHFPSSASDNKPK